ncbi:MAG: T9SS type A sorting domain-containing protein [Bacteroidales bacterium]|nr:T9SS type A sorting domain-containing protein [Bacteroidales bacterium]
MKKIITLLSIFCISIQFMYGQNVAATDSMDVIHYDINLDLVHLSHQTLSGYSDAEVLPQTQQQKNLYFDLLGLNVDSVLVNGQTMSFQYNDTLLSIPAENIIGQGDTISTRVYYHGQPVVEAANWGGFHFLSDSSLAYNLGIAFKANPHNYGKVWFPCADNFTDHATYEFHIRTKAKNMAVCSGTKDSVTTHTNSDKTWHWSLKQPIPTYLASIAVSDFAVIEQTYTGQQGDIPVYLHVSPSDSSDAINSFANLTDIIGIYEEAFGPYRWPRVGYTGTVKGAMEHVTSIAFPRHAIDGTLNYQDLIAHELSHSWFGNLVTCETALDMWLNEGWAVYSEAIAHEGLNGKKGYKDYMRSKLHEVVQEAHIKDNGYRALYGIPHEYTYGATVYDKGATVVHSLRNYLGDSLFFATTKAYLDSFAFDNASTADMNQFINNYSGINVDDFFDAWVYRPGFSHFSVDSFNYITGPSQFNTEVYINQRLVGTSQYANSNKLELGFLMDNQEIIYKTVTFSGADTVALFNLPEKPVNVLADPNEKISDATTDYYTTLKNKGIVEFPDTYAKLDIQDIPDSAFVRITHHWIGAQDSSNIQPSLYHISRKRYWQVEGVFSNGFHTKGSFRYQRTNSLDAELIQSVMDSIAILHKSNLSDPWRPVSFTQSGSAFAGSLIVDTLRKGYYTLARYDKSLGYHEKEDTEKIYQIIPNPAKEMVTIKKTHNRKIRISFYNPNGQLINTSSMETHQKQICVSGFKPGIYFVHLRELNSDTGSTKKLVIQR